MRIKSVEGSDAKEVWQGKRHAATFYCDGPFDARESARMFVGADEKAEVLRLCIPWLLDAHAEALRRSIYERKGYRGVYKLLADRAKAALGRFR